jgi:hypothetical protein
MGNACIGPRTTKPREEGVLVQHRLSWAVLEGGVLGIDSSPKVDLGKRWPDGGRTARVGHLRKGGLSRGGATYPSPLYKGLPPPPLAHSSHSPLLSSQALLPCLESCSSARGNSTLRTSSRCCIFGPRYYMGSHERKRTTLLNCTYVPNHPVAATYFFGFLTKTGQTPCICSDKIFQQDLFSATTQHSMPMNY